MNQTITNTNTKRLDELSVGESFKDVQTDRIFRVIEKTGRMAEVYDIYNEKRGVWPVNAVVEVVQE